MQFTQLASPKGDVVEASLRELACEHDVSPPPLVIHYWIDHNRVMELMGLDQNSVLVIHMGVPELICKPFMSF